MTVGQLAREYRWAKEPQRSYVMLDGIRVMYEYVSSMTYEEFAAKIEAAFVAGWEARDAASTD